jgi:hypothetical protein
LLNGKLSLLQLSANGVEAIDVSAILSVARKRRYLLLQLLILLRECPAPLAQVWHDESGHRWPAASKLEGEAVQSFGLERGNGLLMGLGIGRGCVAEGVQLLFRASQFGLQPDRLNE